MSDNPWVGVRRAIREPFSARAWRELLYCLFSLPLGLIGLAAVLSTVVLGVLSVFVIIVPLLPIFLAIARGLAGLYRTAARGLLKMPIHRPLRPRRRKGLFGWLAYLLADPVAWRALAYLAIRFPLGVAEFLFGFGLWLYGLAFTFYPLLWQLQSGSRGVRSAAEDHKNSLSIDGFYFDTWPRAFLLAIGGLLVLAATPWVRRAVLAPDRWLLARLLGPSDESLRIRELEENRANALNEAALTLRRIERDLHDGVQARLVALGMDLGRAEKRLGSNDPDGALGLITASRADVKDIVRLLREVVRGIHPPALDSGLEPALTTLAARSPIPAAVRVDMPRRPSASVETMLYYSAAELLTNAGKHSEAKAVAITLLSNGGVCELIVTDDGKGGASAQKAGSGLRGLAERARTLDGTFDVSSPPGGPTTVTITVPAAL